MSNKNYDFNKSLLKKIRTLNEGLKKSNFLTEGADVITSKDGERVSFNGINTVGFLRNMSGHELTNKNDVVMGIGTFLKASGLILDIADVQLFNGRIIITSANIKNPGVSFIKSIIIDTDLDDPNIKFIESNLNINGDYMTLIGNLTKAYNDPQIGRNNLIKISQSNIV